MPYIKNGSPLDVHLKGELRRRQRYSRHHQDHRGQEGIRLYRQGELQKQLHAPSHYPRQRTIHHRGMDSESEIAENECVADFTSSHDELEKLMLVNGTEPRCGVMNDYWMVRGCRLQGDEDPGRQVAARI